LESEFSKRFCAKAIGQVIRRNLDPDYSFSRRVLYNGIQVDFSISREEPGRACGTNKTVIGGVFERRRVAQVKIVHNAVHPGKVFYIPP
jgi:hypothetical protein